MTTLIYSMSVSLDGHIAGPDGAIDWAALSQLTFEAPDLGSFPCLGLAYAAGRAMPRSN